MSGYKMDFTFVLIRQSRLSTLLLYCNTWIITSNFCMQRKSNTTFYKLTEEHKISFVLCGQFLYSTLP